MSGRHAKRVRSVQEASDAPLGATVHRSTHAKTETVQQSHVTALPDDEHVDGTAGTMVDEHDVLCSRIALTERKIQQLRHFGVEQRGDAAGVLLFDSTLFQNKRISDTLSASISPTTTELTLVKAILSENDLLTLRPCTALRKLSIVNCLCPSGLAPLFALKSLEELSLLRTRPVVNVDGIHELPSLRVLDLSETAVDTVCVRALGRCKNLVSLFLRSCMCDTDCSDLVKIHTLEELDMSDSHFKANVCALLCLPHLRVLHGPEKCSHAHGAPAEVSCTKLRTFSVHKCVSLPIVELSKMKELEEVSFSHCNLKTRDVVNLAGLQHLRILSICSTDIGDSALRSLGKCAFLEKLNLSVSIYLIDVSPLADVLTLEELNLRDCSCVKRGAGDLGRLPHLRILNLKNTGVTDSCLVGLGTSRSLVKLVLSSCRFVTDITPVLGIATLEELNVLDCKEMTPKEHDLSRLPNLRSLSIGRLDHFASKGSDLTCPFGLTNLNLRCDYQLSPTSSFIEKMQTLVELEVDDGLHINLDGLSQLPHLRTLSLHSLRYPQGVNSLLKCTSITKLHLIRLYKSTDLCPLEDMKSLDELHLTSINLLPNSVIGIPPFLRHLKVASCNVTNKSFSKICNSNAFVYLKLLHCKHLTDISFVQNMKRLEKFFLVCCGKVCNGLECLIKLPFLHYVYITRSLFTETLYSPLQEKGLTVIAHQFPQQLIL